MSGPGEALQRIAIVGAGIFGVTAALELSRRGHAVELFDPGAVPNPLAASTDISKMIRMDYWERIAFYTELMEEAFLGWDAWNAEWGEELSITRPGSCCWPALRFTEAHSRATASRFFGARGHAVERLDAAALERRFPAWSAGRYPDGYFNPRAGWAESGRVVKRLAARARSLGISIRTGVAFQRLAEGDACVMGFVDRDGYGP